MRARQSVCSSWTNEITFTTAEQYAKPTALTASDIGTTSATISWTGSADNYDLRYKKATGSGVDVNTDFDDSSFGGWTTIDADGDGYNWEIYSTSTSYLNDAPGTWKGHNNSLDRVVSGSFSNVYGVLTPDNYLVSPLVNLGGTITFWAYSNGSNY